MKQLKSVFTLIMILALAGCAGTDFVRPSEDTLALGVTKRSDVIARFGQPKREGQATKNDVVITTAAYAFANAVGEPLYPGITPARGLGFYFHNDTLVGHEFLSSFKNDGTDFEDGKVSKIQKGKTTKDEVIGLLGKPTGAFIYPMIQSPSDKALVYQYSHVSGGPFNMKLFKKLLVVSYGQDGVVTNVAYSTSGQK